MAGRLHLDPDFAEFCGCLTANDVRFLVVGGYAVAAHGHPRYTDDLDIWLLLGHENALGVLRALDQFGFGSLGLVDQDFLRPNQVVQLGYPPLRIDLLTNVDGLDFDECWPRRVIIDIGGRQVPFLAREDLLTNKRTSARAQDLADVEALDP